MPKPRTATVDPLKVAAIRRFSAYPLPRFNAEMIIQPFGTNYNGFYAELGMLGHNGWDIRARTGTRLYAVFDGTVAQVYTDRTGGKAVELVTEGVQVPGVPGTFRLRVIYYHLEGWDVTVKDGVHVGAGQFIATADNTGKYTTGAHLHFGLKIDRKTKDGWELIDRDNGFFGAIDPEPFWPDDSWQTVPADTRYGKPRMALVEFVWLRYWGPIFRSKYGREITPREMNAAIYGRWTLEEIAVTGYEWRERPKS